MLLSISGPVGEGGRDSGTPTGNGEGGKVADTSGRKGGFSANLQTLESFKKRVDDLLDDLEGSAADPKHIGQDTLKSTQLGTGFTEATDLYGAYHRVHGKLKELSKTFADQIEAMRLLAHIADNGYRNVDEEQRDRLWAIQRRTDRYYKAARKDDDTQGSDAGRPTPEGSPTSTDY